MFRFRALRLRVSRLWRFWPWVVGSGLGAFRLWESYSSEVRVSGLVFRVLCQESCGMLCMLGVLCLFHGELGFVDRVALARYFQSGYLA